MQNNITTIEYNGSPEQLLIEIREACKDIADYRPDVIEMRPDCYEFIKANSMYISKKATDFFIPYYYGIRVKVKENLNKPFKIIRGGEECA